MTVEPEQTEGPSTGTSSKPVTIQLEDIIHVGPGTICGKFLRTFWHPVLQAQTLEPGRTKPLRILGEDFTLYRGENGTYNAVASRCAHRGTLLSLGWVEDNCIRCRYHGWKYDETGQCVEQPNEDERFTTRIKIRSYPTQEYLGLVFVYFGEGEPPELPRFPEFEDTSDGGLQTSDSYIWPCSFFNNLENDQYHLDWVHREFLEKRGQLSAPGEQELSVEETDYGFVARSIKPIHGSEPSKHAMIRIMPNMMMWRASVAADVDSGWGASLAWRVPVNDDSFTTLSVIKIFASESAIAKFREDRKADRAAVEDLPSISEIQQAILRGDMSFEDFPGRTHQRLFNIGDFISQVGQGPAGLLNDEHLGRTDVEIAMLRRIYRRELQALAEGRPLKKWDVPNNIVSVLQAARD